jgi:hypothetical protein
MKRRSAFLFLAAVGAMVAVAALSEQKKPRLLLLDWAGRAKAERPPVAVLIELGVKDTSPTRWDGKATLKGATVVRREGYRFRPADKLTGGDGWEASSHRGLRVPPRNVAVARMEGIATVGVVLHLAGVAADATLTVAPTREGAPADPAVVPLKDVLTGNRQPIWGGAAVVRLVTTATALSSGKTEDDFPAAAYGPDGTLWVAYVGYRVRDVSRRVEQKPLAEQPADFKELFTPGFADQLFVKYFRDGKWSAPIAVTGPNEDLVRCAIAVEGDGTAWAMYSANRGDEHSIFARPIRLKDAPVRPGPEQRLTEGRGQKLGPVACTTQAGQVRVAYQDLGINGHMLIGLLNCSAGRWREGIAEGGVTAPTAKLGGSWCPAIVAGQDRGWWVAHDGYQNGDYDVWVSDMGRRVIGGGAAVATSPRFEARPSLCNDDKGRLWVAYEEGPERWGQDYGALVPDAGEPLYSSRSVRVVCVQDGKLFRPAAELPTSKVKAPVAGEPLTTQNYEKATRYSGPRLGLDGKGRLWLTYRQKFGSRYSSHPGSYWLTFARRLDGDHWTEPVEVHHSDGLLDSRPVVLPHPAGGVLIVHNTDGRYTTPNDIQNRLYTSYLDLPGEPAEPKLVPHESGDKDAGKAKEHAAALARIRAYRVAAGGKKYQLLRGEFHRHTEVSWDGGPDGSLEDMFRYALDAAALDWIGNGDHDNGAGREYPWWLTQKLTDAYHVADHFTPLFCYERSVAYPHGHRNCLFARRGVRTLPRLAQPDPDKRVAGIHADDTKMLYRYLKELDGICAVHTSATGMGTDWRDNDPMVEPLVEIYQGDRNSYEEEGAPRAGYKSDSGKKPINIAGWYPKGYINNALAKGYRLGFESSSDHWSTHISYCVAVAERHDRAAILAALRQRHCYAATDNIVLDVRSGPHIMGDAFKTADAPALEVNVIGTAPLAQIDIIRDSKVVETIRPGAREHKLKWADPKPEAGTHYYYVRVQQKDGQLAWGSPLWIDYAR